ncbi:hypothetical protein IIB34_08425, partial [PVC group bacterium]|nr:hypothetical protein [PVC group bacterium]
MSVLKSKKTKRINRENISVLSSVLQYIRKDDNAVKSGLYLTPFFLLTGLILILFLKYEVRLPKEGFPAEKSYYALDDFYYVDPDLTTIEKQKAARKVLPVYEFDVEAYEDLLGRTRMIFEALAHDNIEGAKDVFSWPKAGSVYQFYVDRAVDKQEVLIESLAIISRYLNRYLVSSKDFDSLESEGFYFLTVSRKDSEEKSVRLSDIHVIDSERLRRSLQDDIAYFLPDERKIRATLLQIYIHVLSKPTLNFDAALTETKRKSQADIQADVTKLVKKGSLILERGTNVTALHLRQLKSMGSGLEILNKNPKAFSMIVLFLFHSYLFCLFMIMFCRGRDVFTPNFLLTTGIMYLLANMAIKISYYFSGFVLIIPLVISILFFAILGETLLGVLFTIILVINIPVIYAPISIPLTPFLIGALFSAVFAHNIMKRSQLLRVGFFTGLVYFLVFFLFDVMYETREINEAVRYAGTMAFGGFVSSLLVMGVLPLFEHFFHLSTNVQLLELSDLNHPLLRRLLREAPGTYHHSLMVG